MLALIWAFERAKSLRNKQAIALLCALIRDYRLPHECVPSEMKQHAEVWACAPRVFTRYRSCWR